MFMGSYTLDFKKKTVKTDGIKKLPLPRSAAKEV